MNHQILFIGFRISRILFLTLQSPAPRALPSVKNRIGRDKTYWKAFTTLWFWRLEILGKFQLSCQEQSSVNAPVGTLYTYLNYAVQPPMEVFTPFAAFGIDRCIYISAWGFGVARFDRMGNFQEPLIVKRATVQGFTPFLCLYVNLSLSTMKRMKSWTSYSLSGMQLTVNL